ncbi:hypothetical protein F5Y05DRAFT_384082 [Hypoxylon sp. FL0543]|nr:hypothetical protein F5Y05DRAFT_384082 [Hypoxylon sp. FL0543]
MSIPQDVGLPFVVSTGLAKPDPNLRKFIRRHVMMGKNRGKTRPTTRKRREASELGDVSNPVELPKASSNRPSCITAHHTTIPSRVGSELSTIQFADTVDPSLVATILQFSSIAKQALYPLETCISFDQSDKRQWIEPLAFDSAYLHTMIFTTHDYFNLLLHRAPCGETSPHFFKAVRILRERLLREDDDPSKISTLTTSVVLALTGHAILVNEYASAEHHLEGLRKIVNLRGGISSLKNSAKLLLEILRCDLGMVFHCGSKPLFLDILHWEPVLSSLMPHATKTPYNPDKFPSNMNDELALTWRTLERFCFLIDSVSESRSRLTQQEFLNAMASVMYRLLNMEFGISSTDGVIRLGLLAFSSSVFLQWKQMRLPYAHFTALYKDSLMRVQISEIPVQLQLWLLTVGAISVFGEEDQEWLRPWLRVTMNLCQIGSWTDMRDILCTFMWIGLAHDELGKGVFDTTYVSLAVAS